MSEETGNRRGKVIVAAVILVLIWLPVSPISLLAFAGYLDCRSGDHLPDPSVPDIGFYVPCDPWENDLGVYDTEWRLMDRFYYAVGQGNGIREAYGNLALFDVIWARLHGVTPVLAGGQDRGKGLEEDGDRDRGTGSDTQRRRLARFLPQH
jgi:hypothetical protein